MENPIVRGIVAVVAGLVAAFAVVFVCEALGHMLYPPPPGLDISNPDDQKRMMEVIPTGAKVAVVIAWFLGTLAGSLVAVKIGRRPLYAWVIAGITILLSIVTTMMFPHPVWMIVAAVVLPVLAAVLAIRLGRPRVSL